MWSLSTDSGQIRYEGIDIKSMGIKYLERPQEVVYMGNIFNLFDGYLLSAGALKRSNFVLGPTIPALIRFSLKDNSTRTYPLNPALCQPPTDSVKFHSVLR
jgi:hypothetical protein